jgi:hypothetical protein
VLGGVLLAVSTATVWATANTPPHITSFVTSAPVINEGQTVTASATFTDPDAGDNHVVRFFWRDGHFDEFHLSPGQFSAQATHTYQDSWPEEFNILLAVYDRQTPPGSPQNDNTDGQGKDWSGHPILVKNVPPSFGPAIKVTKDRLAPNKVSVDGTLVDPGADTFTVAADFGDHPAPLPIRPSPPVMTPCTVERQTFHCEHQYPAPGLPSKTYQIKLTARDDDGGTGAGQTSVRIP